MMAAAEEAGYDSSDFPKFRTGEWRICYDSFPYSWTWFYDTESLDEVIMTFLQDEPPEDANADFHLSVEGYMGNYTVRGRGERYTVGFA